jgi:hypothetical protein
MALQSTVEPWLLLFPIHSRSDSLDRGSTRRKAPTYRQDKTNRIKAHRHECLEWDSNPRSQCSSGRDNSYLRHRGYCDREPEYTASFFYFRYSTFENTDCFIFWSSRISMKTVIMRFRLRFRFRFRFRTKWQILFCNEKFILSFE